MEVPQSVIKEVVLIAFFQNDKNLLIYQGIISALPEADLGLLQHPRWSAL